MARLKDEPELTDNPIDLVTRRNFLTCIVADDEDTFFASIAERMEVDELHIVKMAIRAIAAELMATSLAVQDHGDRIETTELGGKVNGALLAGLLGMDGSGYAASDEVDAAETLTPAQLDELDDETKVRRFHRIVYRTGALVREGVGITVAAK